MKRAHALMLALLAGLAGCLPGYLTSQKPRPGKELEGQAAPPIAGINGDGQMMRLRDYQGKVILLSFWHSQCPPCRAYFAHEKTLVSRYASQGFVLLGVNADQSPFELKNTQTREGLPWPSWWDGPGGPIAQSLQVDRFPTFFLLDRAGVIRMQQVGVPADGELENRIEELLKQDRAGEKTS